MDKAEKIKKANQILELVREGYSDYDIRKKLSIEPDDYVKLFRFIKTDQHLATEAMLLFEKEVIRLHEQYRMLLEFTKTCDEKQFVGAVKQMTTISQTKCDLAQKLGAVDPQRFVLEIQNEEKKDYASMTLDELLKHYDDERAKYNPQ